ncbi:branched-chain amino acid aminotransferase [Grosmannia clavigera kw1407]|uniref:Branched-chain amino acid aminotransferase n=1 Tax=Grosmannia clavigera (strain kw1407 / UAMH 11150) TaxID=655863 RepID=F0XQR7_GROCL|nr:branched-chain amino acid aminotransferase [Grosmannia clavigera kw1407]EFW99699.1 branched-chain amino acid aminotransferase [Grosmannia clavigera kw1407]
MAAFPPPPAATIDWANGGFRVREVNGHVESHYTKETGQWSAPVFVEDPYVRIHGMAPALNYGQQAYEGLKAFRTPGDQGIQIFRADKNAERPQRSAEVISVPAVPTALFLDAVHAAVARNAEFVPPHETGAALYIRPQVYGTSAQLGLSPPEEYAFLVYVLPTGVYHGTAPVRALVVDDFDRAAPQGTGHVKVGSNYAPVLRWSEQARRDGYGITLHLDSVRHEDVDEFSTSGFIGVKRGDGNDDITLVFPDSQCVIASVTSDSVQKIAGRFGWAVLATGTAAALVPIQSITRRIDSGSPGSLAAAQPSLRSHPRVRLDGSGEETITYLPADQPEAGPVCLRLLAQLKGIQQGSVVDPFGWVTAVTASDLNKAGE